MQLRHTLILTWILALGLGASWCAAEEPAISAQLHPWGRFQPGAWKLVRVVTETFDEHGAVVNTNSTETRTTLAAIEDNAVNLEVEVTVEVAGKQFDGQPQCIRQGFHGESAGPEVKIQPSKPARLHIEDRDIDCRLQQLDSSGPTSRTKTLIYYSDTLPPYILKRESVTTDLDGKNILGEMTLEVVAMEMPYKVLSEIKNVASVRIVQKGPKGTITTLAMISTDVPGGVVCHTSKETDMQGRVVRRSTLELVNFGLQPEDDRPSLFGRKRPPRNRKQPHGSPR